MHIDITGHQVEVTQPIRDYINTKFERIKRHFDQLIDVHVILNVENKVRHKAEATMMIGGKKFFAESTEDDLYSALDLLTDKLDKQIRRHKDKMINKHRDEAVRLNQSY